ncbi:MAG: hypothetical protein KGV50_04320 [Gammaproteobacteria bacterium]|nr:hypothetical protein [Gammaproteobacteria bacterium]
MSINQQETTFLNPNDSFIVCCFFTKSYLTHAASLKQSLDNVSLGYYFKEVEDAGYWEANTRIKPHFILDCLEKFPQKNILYLDADAVVKQKLDYFNHISADVAFYNTKGMEGMSHDYLASTLFFNNNENTHKLVKQWIKEQENGSKTQVDQDSLDNAMQQLENELTVEPLPTGYIKIFDKDYTGEIYIEQYQASRSQTKLRRKRIRQRNQAILLAFFILIIISLWKYVT